MALVWAYLEAIAAAYAARRQERQFLRPFQKAFRIMAPQAAQIAALKKYAASDTRPVVNRKVLNVEYLTYCVFVHMLTSYR